MNLLDYIKGMKKPELELFAKDCSTSVGQLKQVAYANRRASASLAISIDRVSKGEVPCESLRPDIDWGYLRGTSSEAA